MMFDIIKLKRRAMFVSLGTLMLGLIICANLGWAQEAPRPEGSSRIKPPMIKPPMQKSQNSNSGVKGSSRRRVRRRAKRQVTHRTVSAEIPTAADPTPILEMPSQESPGSVVGGGGSGPASIKPPMANNDNVSLNGRSQPKKPINGGVLNGKAISLPNPLYPPIAKAARASGTVTVQIIIDEQGDVISAHAVAGHPLLQSAAVTAARDAKFTPTRLEGQPVKVSGFIT